MLRTPSHRSSLAASARPVDHHTPMRASPQAASAHAFRGMTVCPITVPPAAAYGFSAPAMVRARPQIRVFSDRPVVHRCTTRLADRDGGTRDCRSSNRILCT